ncbi:MAG: hypothetical protein IPK99_13690 [Flavobacteriales bacterium]|nr:hypothetical protein [Flavobacteriales bacterium]
MEEHSFTTYVNGQFIEASRDEVALMEPAHTLALLRLTNTPPVRTAARSCWNTTMPPTLMWNKAACAARCCRSLGKD